MIGEARRAEIAANWAAVQQLIATSCAAAGRSLDEVTVVAVTKTFPATDVGHLAALGLREVGENRHQEAAPKAAECSAAGIVGLQWHFVGQLQSNKAAAVAAYADVVHAVDRACTAESEHLYSHRRDGITGRFAGLALLAPQ